MFAIVHSFVGDGLVPEEVGPSCRRFLELRKRLVEEFERIQSHEVMSELSKDAEGGDPNGPTR